MSDAERDPDAEPGGREPTEHSAARSDSALPDEDHLRELRREDADFARVLPLVRHLRRHCPWDARQTPRSLRPYLLEEAGEVADAVAGGDDRELPGELGDLLLNVAFQVVLAEERGSFGATDVVRRLEQKMKDRHPHVYGDAEEPPPWEELKAREGAEGGESEATGDEERDGRESGPLGAALRAQRRAAERNFDWPDVRGALAKVREEADEMERLADAGADPDRVREEVGDLLFAAVNAARLSAVDPDRALVEAVSKFRDRWGRVLELAADRGLEPEEATLEELDTLWDLVKDADRESERDD
ncbi:MAG: nucleoside triphosphate pyrophosphohydrolase [Candidatus Palauibacterales bacterium]|nr:nucleoside triphosphate pyrophosphohydrolase [Candidatus Palauibacterales bacterium]